MLRYFPRDGPASVLLCRIIQGLAGTVISIGIVTIITQGSEGTST